MIDPLPTARHEHPTAHSRRSPLKLRSLFPIGLLLAVMTALNIAHELLQMKLPGGIDLQDFRRRIESMQSRVDQALALQENLF